MKTAEIWTSTEKSAVVDVDGTFYDQLYSEKQRQGNSDKMILFYCQQGITLIVNIQTANFLEIEKDF